MKRLTFFFILFTLNGCAHPTTAPQSACKKNWVFFDLGNTLVDTRDDHKNVKYLPEAEEYLQELKALGFRIGMISNIPPTWGKSTPERYSKLKEVLEKEWIEDSHEHHLAWEYFEPNGIFLPRNPAELKPAPILFEEALKLAHSTCSECPVIFQSENQTEIDAANRAGMIGHLVGIDTKKNRYYPIQKISLQCVAHGS